MMGSLESAETRSPAGNEVALCRALGKLIGWLDTWEDANGAYNGYIVHRTEGKRMGRVHDTAWTQAAMVRGYGNLYRKSGEARWETAMLRAADLLASRYDPATGRWRHTGHEDERFQSLVSCALAVCALLSIRDLVDEARRRRFAEAAADHARRYWFAVLWVESEGAFRFSETDYYSRPGEDRFVVNFNTMAAEALLAIHDATGEPEFLERARAVGSWLLVRWDETRCVNDALLAGKVTAAEDPASDWMPPGGFSYQFSSLDRQPDNYVTLYAGLSLRGFWALYRATGDERFAEIIREQCAHIVAMRDPETHLFYHTTRGGRIQKNPRFIAGAGMVLVGLQIVQSLHGVPDIPSDTIASILGRTYRNGSVPDFLGKNDTGQMRRRGGGVVWEDVAASVNWNAQWFEFLTAAVADPRAIETLPCKTTARMLCRRFIYWDSPRTAGIISWSPTRSWGLYLYSKRRPSAWIAIAPMAIYAWLRARLGLGRVRP